MADEIDDFLKAIADDLRAGGEPKAVTVIRYPAEDVDGLSRVRFAVHVYEAKEGASGDAG